MLIFSEEEAFSPLTSRTYPLLTFLVLGLRCPRFKFHSKSSSGKGDATYLIILLRLGERSFLKENLGVIIKSGKNGGQAGKNNSYSYGGLLLSIKNLLASAGDVGLVPGLGRSPEAGNGNLLQYSCLGNPMNRGARELQSMGSQGVRHDLATNQQQLITAKS